MKPSKSGPLELCFCFPLGHQISDSDLLVHCSLHSEDKEFFSEESSEGLSTLRVLNEAAVVDLNHPFGADGS